MTTAARAAFLVLFLLMVGATQLHAQRMVPQLLTEFKVEGYTVERMGYPGQLVPDGKGNLNYVEYWEPKYGRRWSGLYLQSVGLKGYEENWFTSITEAQSSVHTQVGLYRMGTTLVPITRTFDAASKGQATLARFIGLDGKETVQGAVKLSNFSKKAEGYAERIILSQDSAQLCWMGWQGERPGSYNITLYNRAGRQLYTDELDIAKRYPGYGLQDQLLDAQGNLYLLLAQDSWAGKREKDTLALPKLIRYNTRLKTAQELVFPRQGLAHHTLRMGWMPDATLSVLAAAQDDSSKGFVNDRKGELRPWNRIGYYHISTGDTLGWLKAGHFPLSDTLVKAYATTGAKLADARLVTDKSQVAWLWEEQYTSKETVVRGDVVGMAFDASTGQAQWMSRLQKRQASPGSADLLSYTLGLRPDFYRCIYLSELGASGIIRAGSFNRSSGIVVYRDLQPNEGDAWYFFPTRSTQVDATTMYLLGTGPLGQNAYRLIAVDLR